MNKTSGTLKKVVVIVVAVLIAAALAWQAYNYWQMRLGAERADKVLETMQAVIPGLGEDSGVPAGQGRDPLPQVEIDGYNIVGCIEVPSIGVMAPVLSEGHEDKGFAATAGGSPVQGNFMLTGGRYDIFRKLADVRPGDIVAFTDIDGVRYTYRVVTQFHLKDWDESDLDLMLCYRTDGKTQFVLGCKLAEL